MSTPRSSATGAALFPLADGQLLIAGGSNQQTAPTGAFTTSTSSTGELYGFATVETNQTDYSPGTPAVVTTLTASNASGSYGGTVSLSATLIQTSNSADLSGQTISFTLNGTAVGTSTTNSSGVATLSGVSLSGIAVGTISTGVGARFAGTSSRR
jgi:hypothetical protein